MVAVHATHHSVLELVVVSRLRVVLLALAGALGILLFLLSAASCLGAAVVRIQTACILRVVIIVRGGEQTLALLAEALLQRGVQLRSQCFKTLGLHLEQEQLLLLLLLLQ